MKQLAELPPNLTLAQLASLLNDRIRDVNDILTGAISNPAESDVDMAAHRITNLADPRDDLDAVTLRTLKRFQPAAAAQAIGSGLDAYAIVFDKDAALVDGETIPAYVVGVDRTGNPLECWLYSRVAAPGDIKINFGVLVPTGTAVAPVEKILMVNAKTGVPVDLILNAGQTGPVFFTPTNLVIFGVTNFPHGTIVYPKIDTGASATMCSMGVVVKR